MSESEADLYEKSLSDRMLYLMSNSVLTDVVFEVGPEARPVYAHRAILASGSPVFNAMFRSDLAEATTQPIRVPDVTFEGFQLLVRFIYSGSLELTNPGETAMTLVAANKYLMDSLVGLCRDYLRSNLPTENALTVLLWMRRIGEQEIIDLCLKAIDLDFERLSSTKEFVDLDASSLALILDRQSLLCRESTIFEAVCRWAREECKAKGNDPDVGANLREVLSDVVPLIRFPLLSVRELTSQVYPSGILSAEELVSVIHSRSLDRPNADFSNEPRRLLTGDRKLQEVNWQVITVGDGVKTTAAGGGSGGSKRAPSSGTSATGSQALAQTSAATSSASVERNLYGAVDFSTNRKLLLGGVRLFASSLLSTDEYPTKGQHAPQPLFLTVYCLAEKPSNEESSTAVCDYVLTAWCKFTTSSSGLQKRGGTPSHPLLDVFLPNEVVIYPGLFYRMVLQWTSHQPGALASKPVEESKETTAQLGDVRFEFALPNNSRIGGSPLPPTVDSPEPIDQCPSFSVYTGVSGAPPFCNFLNAFHYVDVATLAL